MKKQKKWFQVLRGPHLTQKRAIFHSAVGFNDQPTVLCGGCRTLWERGGTYFVIIGAVGMVVAAKVSESPRRRPIMTEITELTGSWGNASLDLDVRS